MKKTQELQELKAKNKTDLFKDLKESQKKLTQLRFSASFKNLKNYREIAKTRKKIARIWTILGESLAEQNSKEVK